MDREIESKYDVPLSLDLFIFFEQVYHLLPEMGFSIEEERVEHLFFVYYDTEGEDFHKRGHTLRKVSGFDTSYFPAPFRYDQKMGSLENRLEDSRWSEEDLSIPQIRVLFGIQENLQEAARSKADYDKILVSRSGTVLELTLDRFTPEGSPPFTEFEVELVKGEESLVWLLSEAVGGKFGLKPLTTQKYSRIVSSRDR